MPGLSGLEGNQLPLEGTSVTVFRPIIHGLTALGLEWKSLFESCGIDPALIADCEARVPADVFDRFWVKAAELTGDPCFGLHVASHMRPVAVNIVGYLLMSSATLREGLERVVPYQKLVFGRDFIGLIDRGASALIRLEPRHADPLRESIQTEYKAMFLPKLLDWVSAADFRASEARFRHPPAAPQSRYEQDLGCPVKFQCKHSELVVSRTLIDQPTLHGNPEIAQLHEEYAKRHLDELEDKSVARKVKILLMSRLDRGPCPLAEVARSLFMSPRTLQRRLDEEGCSFSATLDALRRELCLDHLERPHTSLCEIAYVAGFSDTSALSRAVHRWTGQAPLEYRRAHRAG